MDDVRPFLEGWSVVTGDQQYTVVDGRVREGRIVHLLGNVSGHPHIKEGHLVRSSALLRLDVAGRNASSLNREYRLGEPDPAWVFILEHQGLTLVGQSFAYDVDIAQLRAKNIEILKRYTARFGN